MDLDELEIKMKGNQFETLVPIKILGNILILLKLRYRSYGSLLKKGDLYDLKMFFS